MIKLSRKFVALTGASVLFAAFSMGANASLDTKFTRQCKPLAPETGEEPKTKPGLLSPRVYKQLEKARIAIGEKNFAEATQALDAAVKNAKEGTYQRALVDQTYAYIALSQSKYVEAARYFEKALQAEDLPYKPKMNMKRNLANAYAAANQYDKALTAMQNWFKDAFAPKSQDYALLAQIYSQLDKTREMICPTYYAIKLDKKPNKNYHSLLLAGHWELEDFPGSAEILRTMIDHFPEESTYWSQLVSIYLKLDRPADALAVAELGYKNNLWQKEGDLKRLSQLYALQAVPYKAAQVMQKGIEDNKIESNEKHWKSVAGNWHLAHELDKALVAYERAGRLASDGEHFMRMGNIYVEREDWKKAIDAYNKALGKGGLKANDTGRVLLNKGIAQFQAGNSNAAIATLEKAQKYDNVSNNASQWKNHIRSTAKSLAAG